ncbi:PAS domain S-box protein [Paenibacillus sp. S-38]|uniref:PAS domain S-box protein n=1 Tax=Paenibacillus sp. S-38 TaxID=3416710 RepID=UPI003CEF2E2C
MENRHLQSGLSGQWDALEILEQTRDGFFSLDRHCRITYVNQQAADMLLCERESLIGRTMWDVFPDTVSSSLFTNVRKAVQDSVVTEFEEYYPAPMDCWYDVRAVPVREGLAVFFRSITARKKIAQQREQHYKSLFLQNPDAVYSLDLEGHFLSVNPATAHLSGYSAQELLEMSFLPFIHESALERTCFHFQQAANGVPQAYENIIVRKDGTMMPCHVTNMPIIIDGKIVGVFGIAKDIRERKQAEYQILDSQLRLRSLLYNHPDAIYTLDAGKRMVDCNPAGEQLLGYTKEELVTKTLADVVSSVDIGLASDMIERALTGGTADAKELLFTGKEGSPLFSHCTVVPILIHGEVLGSYMVLKDVTEQRETEKLLLKSEKLHIAGQLAAAVAHEIRNPLTALKGFLKLLESSNENRERGYMFAILQEEMERIESITNELLVLAKPQSASYVKLDLTAVLQSVLTLVNPQAIMQDVQILTKYGEVPAVLGEGNQLKQVFVNLLKNAIEVMPEGGEVTIGVETLGREVQVLIRDQGRGITEEQISRLGEPFYSTKEKGTGLGLMVSKKIIEAHGGRLEVTSRLDVGTTVHVILPVMETV